MFIRLFVNQLDEKKCFQTGSVVSFTQWTLLLMDCLPKSCTWCLLVASATRLTHVICLSLRSSFALLVVGIIAPLFLDRLSILARIQPPCRLFPRLISWNDTLAETWPFKGERRYRTQSRLGKMRLVFFFQRKYFNGIGHLINENPLHFIAKQMKKFTQDGPTSKGCVGKTPTYKTCASWHLPVHGASWLHKWSQKMNKSKPKNTLQGEF